MIAYAKKALVSLAVCSLISCVISCAPAEQSRPVPGTKIASDDGAKVLAQAKSPATPPATAPATATKKVSAKNIYYEPAGGGPTVPPAQQQAAVRFWIELSSPMGGAPQTVTPEYVFYTGDRTRYRVAANQNCFVYVATEGPMGDRYMLFPSPQAGMDNRVQRQGDFVMPTSNGFFTFADPAGPERVVIIMSPTRIQELDQISQARSAAKSVQLTPEENRAFTKFLDKQDSKGATGGKSKNIVYEPVTEGPQPGGYYATDQPGFTEPVTIKVTLQHRPASERR